jgi:hypothetical protein
MLVLPATALPSSCDEYEAGSSIRLKKSCSNLNVANAAFEKQLGTWGNGSKDSCDQRGIGA